MSILRLKKSSYPNIDPADVGKLPNIGYGEIDNVRTHAIVAGAASTIQADLTAAATSFDVADASYFPSPPFTIQIDDERIRVTSVSGDTFTAVTRGYDDTEAAVHKKNNTAFEVLTEYVYLVADHPVKQIDDVYIDNIKQLITTYTAYTGQSGDEHTDFPGKAVIAFTVDGYIGQQRNIENSGDRATGDYLYPDIKAGHPHQVMETYNYAYAEVSNIAWAEYDKIPGGGAVLTQEYAASVKNDSGADITLAIVVTESNVLKARQIKTLTNGQSTSLNVKRQGGQTNDVVKVVLITGAGPFKITSITKAVSKVPERYGKYAKQTATRRAVISKHSFNQGNVSWLEYVANPDAVNVIEQEHRFNFTLTTAGIVRLAAVNTDGTLVAYIDNTYDTTGTKTLVLKHSGGNWETQGRLIFLTAEGSVNEASLTWPKEVTYETEETQGSILSATSSSHIVIGDDINADASFAVDTTGDYGGSGNLIERPDWVIKHFLVNQLGFSLSEIDATSFSAAGTGYAADGYKFGFLWEGEELSQMAFECRSTLRYDGGKWYLDRLPDTAPAAIKTISSDELEGMFVFNKMPASDLANDLTARFKRNYVTNDYDGICNDSDSASKTKYGTYYLNVDFAFIRLSAMATSVLAHILKQRKTPLMSVEFTVFWEHFDLSVGDTFDISNDLWDGKKFYIENITRDEKTAFIKALEWW